MRLNSNNRSDKCNYEQHYTASRTYLSNTQRSKSIKSSIFIFITIIKSMKKIIVSFVLSTLFIGVGFASNTSSRCKALLEQTKGTAKQQIAEQTCGVTPTITKKVVKKIIGKIPHRSDTTISTGEVKKILADSIII